MLGERNWELWDACLIFFFSTILYLLLGARPQFSWSVVTNASHFRSPSSSPFVFLLLYVLWNPTNSWTQFSCLFFVNRSSITCSCSYTSQCLGSCDMSSWLVINIMLILQTVHLSSKIGHVHNWNLFSHTSFSSKKKRNLIARPSDKESRYASNLLFFVQLVYGKRSSVVGSSVPPGYFPSRRPTSNENPKNCSRHFTYPLFFVFLLTAIRENSRTDQFYIQIKLTWIQALWDTNLNAVIFFQKILVEPGGRTFFVHSLLSPFGKTILITLRFFDHHQRHQNNPLLLLLLLLIHISESNPQLWNEGFL